jgi:hypothetical protein
MKTDQIEKANTATLTWRESRTLVVRLRSYLAYFRSIYNLEELEVPEGEQRIRDDKAYERAVEMNCPPCGPEEIVHAAFELHLDPRPEGLCSPEVAKLARELRPDPQDKAEIDASEIEGVIEPHKDEYAFMGYALTECRDKPILGFLFAASYDTRGLVPDAYAKIEREAVLYNKLHPEYLPILLARLGEAEYASQARELQEATERLTLEDEADKGRASIEASDPRYH